METNRTRLAAMLATLGVTLPPKEETYILLPVSEAPKNLKFYIDKYIRMEIKPKPMSFELVNEFLKDTYTMNEKHLKQLQEQQNGIKELLDLQQKEIEKIIGIPKEYLGQ